MADFIQRQVIGLLFDLWRPFLHLELHARAEQAGRKPSDVPLSIFGAASDEATLHRYQELGSERVVFTVPSRERDHVLPLLDTYAALVAKFALN